MRLIFNKTNRAHTEPLFKTSSNTKGERFVSHDNSFKSNCFVVAWRQSVTMWSPATAVNEQGHPRSLFHHTCYCYCQ